MVFGIVEQHGGHIDVRSAPSEGTTFRMRFPLAEASAEPGTSSAPAHWEPIASFAVLTVDDEPMITMAVADTRVGTQMETRTN